VLPRDRGRHEEIDIQIRMVLEINDVMIVCNRLDVST
jgi:hypothetical protein